MVESSESTIRIGYSYDTLSHKFTGKERDSESGLDNFGARYDSSSMGRFMTPDWSASPEPVPFADISDPQSLNLYSYVKNNPLRYTDPNGHCFWDGCVVEISATIAVVVVASALFVKGLHDLQEKGEKKLKEGGDSTFRCMDSNAACTESEMRGIHDKRTETIQDMGVEAIKNIPAGVATTPTELAVDVAKDALIERAVEKARKKAEEDNKRQREEAERQRRAKQEEEKKKRQRQRCQLEGCRP